MKSRVLHCIAAGLVASAMVIAAPAVAHPRLLGAIPAAKSATVPPRLLSLRFSEPLILAFSQLTLNGPTGRSIVLQPSRLSANRKELIAPLATRLVAGTYTVRWHVVSVDTHRVAGSYRFIVR